MMFGYKICRCGVASNSQLLKTNRKMKGSLQSTAGWICAYNFGNARTKREAHRSSKNPTPHHLQWIRRRFHFINAWNSLMKSLQGEVECWVSLQRSRVIPARHRMNTIFTFVSYNLSYQDTKRKTYLRERSLSSLKLLHFGRDTVAKLVNSRLKEGLYPKARSSSSSLLTQLNGFSSATDM